MAEREYVHARYEPMRKILRWAIEQVGWGFLARLERAQITGLENFPQSGAAILMINHIAFIDPVVVMGNVPRNIVPMAKAEVYWVPIWGIFPWLWGVIPVRRGEVDRAALARALAVLKAGEVVLLAPQGTRQKSLQTAKEGIAYLAYKSGAPIVPIAIEGSEGFPTLNILRWFKPGAYFKIGKPFRFKKIEGRLPREALTQMTKEAMYKLAEILPEQRRGAYSDLSQATTEYIED